MWVARTENGYLFGGLTAYCLETLRGVPMLIESKDPRVRRRLLPDTYDEIEDQQDWRATAVPELERLFLSRGQLVSRDLQRIKKLDNLDSWVLLIPDQHTNAWLSSLNAARLALYELNDLTPEHMERDGVQKADGKQREAILRIHFLAEIQGVLLGELDFGDEGEDLGDCPAP
ncbi:MAG: hypothetical protein Fur0037_24920 [Planctomycetota bacterium]